MTASYSADDASTFEDEQPVRLDGVDEVKMALTAERQLLDGLIDVAGAAVAKQAPPVSDFLSRYWLIPLEQDRTAIEQWLSDLESDQDMVRAAAADELELARDCRRLVKELGTKATGRAALQAALASYDEDFRTEAEGKRSILEAL